MSLVALKETGGEVQFILMNPVPERLFHFQAKKVKMTNCFELKGQEGGSKLQQSLKYLNDALRFNI